MPISTLLRIAAMQETTIDINSDGQIQIVQKDNQINQDDQDINIVCFPVELAEKIANEILRLAKEHAV